MGSGGCARSRVDRDITKHNLEIQIEEPKCREKKNKLGRTNDMACIGSPDISATLEATK